MSRVAAKDAAYYTERINNKMCAAVESIIEVGRLLIEARNALDHGQWQSMFDDENKKRLPFSQRTAQRFMKIAMHPVISNATHVSHLPPSWGTLDALTRIPEENLERLIADGTIRPDIERSEVNEIYGRIVHDGITWPETIRGALNHLLDHSNKKNMSLGMLATHLVDETNTDGGPAITHPQKLYDLSGWVHELGRACEGVMTNGYDETPLSRPEERVRIQRVK